MKRFSLVVSSLFVFLFLALTARAEMIPVTDLYVNPSAVASGIQKVGPFTAFAFYDETRSIAYASSIEEITVGTVFNDHGYGMVYQLRDENNNAISAPGLGTDWTLWVEWDITTKVEDISSVPTGDFYTLSFSSGRLDVWLASANGSFGTDPDPTDDIVPSQLVPVISATVEPDSSWGYLLSDQNKENFFRNLTVVFIPSFVDTDILSSDSIDLSSVSLNLWATEAAASGLSNTSDCGGYPCIESLGGGGSMRIAAVPEPTTMFLLGSGAVLLFFGVRRFKRRPEA